MVVLLTQPNIGFKLGEGGGTTSSLYKSVISALVKGVFHIFKSSRKPIKLPEVG